MSAELITVLCERDGVSRAEAKQDIKDFLKDYHDGEFGQDLEEAFQEYFGLEPDYLLEIM